MLSPSKLTLLLLLISIQCVRPAVVITLGDSYACGNGIHRLRKDYCDASCFVERDMIPGGKYAFRQGLDHIITACSRHRINQTVAQWDDLQLSYPEEATGLWEGSLLIISAGINSARSIRNGTFEQRLIQCLTSHCRHDENNRIENYDEVQEELEAFYTKLATEAAEATVRVMGYPKVFNSNRLRCFVAGVSVRDANFFDSNVLGVNDKIIEAIENVKKNFPDFDIQYVDLTKYYTNGACSPFRTRQIRNINPHLRETSFHPTQWGYDKSYAALLDSLLD